MVIRSAATSRLFAAVAPPVAPDNVGADSVEGTRSSPEPTAYWLRTPWLSMRAPRGDLAVRLTLAALAIVLMNLIEVPHEVYWAVLGTRLTSAGIVLLVAGSLAALFGAVALRVPAWRWLRSLRLQQVVLVSLLICALFDIQFIMPLAKAPFTAPDYPNDGTTLDHYAAQEVIAGHNPYITTDLVAAIRQFNQDPVRTTPLRQGYFKSLPANQYPSKDQLRNVFNVEPSGFASSISEFETRVSYPALAFLPLVPIVWAGAPNVTPFFLACLVALGVLVVLSFPRQLRWFAALAFAASGPFIVAALNGSLDIFYMVLVFAAWLVLRRSWSSALLFGLALAAKQLAWFIAPYYFIAVWRHYGWREALKRVGVSGGVFALINLPFFLSDPTAWVKGVLAPMADPMFPLGSGLVKLGLSGIGPLAPQAIYSGLEAIAVVVCLVYYFRRGYLAPETGMVLAVIPLFFAWRSLTTYFDYVALPTIAIYMARRLRQQGSLLEPPRMLGWLAGLRRTLLGAAGFLAPSR
ncbi:MAG TPA: hypothetical protein VF807_12175 [Ktedonobacterales bacterium]